MTEAVKFLERARAAGCRVVSLSTAAPAKGPPRSPVWCAQISTPDGMRVIENRSLLATLRAIIMLVEAYHKRMRELN